MLGWVLVAADISSHLLLAWHGGHWRRCIAYSHGLEANIFHVQADLFWDLAENFLRQVTFPHCLVEAHELNDVASADPSSIVSQKLAITVQILHQVELLALADAHYDDAGRLARRLDDQRLDATHVMDRSVRQDQQDVVDVLPAGRRCILGKRLDHRAEHGRTG